MKHSRKMIGIVLAAVVLAASFPLGVVIGEYFSLDNRVRRAAYRYIKEEFPFDNPYSYTTLEDLGSWKNGVVCPHYSYPPSIYGESVVILNNSEGTREIQDPPPMYEVIFEDPPRMGTLGPVTVWFTMDGWSYMGFSGRE